MNSEEHPRVIQILMLTRIIWSIMVLFQMLLFMLSFVLWMQSHVGEDFLALPYWDISLFAKPIGMAIAVMAVGNGIGALVLPQIAAKFSTAMIGTTAPKPEDDVARVKRSFTFYLLHLALLEMCCVAGFVFGFYFENPMLTIPFMAPAFLLSVIAFPTVGKLKGLGSV